MPVPVPVNPTTTTESLEADTSAPPPPPIVIHIRKSCLGGPLIDTNLLPNTIEETIPIALVKKLIGKLLESSHKFETILARLGALQGEEMAISHSGSTYTIKLPTVPKLGSIEVVFSLLATALGCCQNLFSKPPIFI